MSGNQRADLLVHRGRVPTTDTPAFVGSVRCTAPAAREEMFTGVAVGLDAENRIFTTLPVIPVPEMTSPEIDVPLPIYFRV